MLKSRKVIVKYLCAAPAVSFFFMRPSSSVGYFTQIYVIAKNAFREAVRDRILYNLVVFVLLLTGAAIFLGELTAGQEVRTIINLGLNAILLFGTFIAIFVGVGLVSKEIEKRTVYAIFAKPVTRAQFLVGKYLGLCLTLLVNTAVMVVGVTLALVYVGGTERIASVWIAVFFIFLELAIITAVAITFSSFSTPALSALFTFFIFVIGHFSSSLREFANAIGSAAAKIVFETIFYLMPNLSLYGFRTQAAYGLFPETGAVAAIAAYTAVYVAILLAVACFIFSRRNFK